MKIKDFNKFFSGTGKTLLKRMGVAAVLGLANRWVKVVVVVVFLLIGLRLLYSQVWQVFRSDVVLPITIGETRVRLNVEVLREINTSRTNRVKHKVTDYSQYERFFDISGEEETDQNL